MPDTDAIFKTYSNLDYFELYKEYKQLKIRAERLEQFIYKGNYYDTPKELFVKQLDTMRELIKILEERAKYEGITYEEV